MSKPIEKRASFDYVRYANCWEDADILIQAASPLQGKKCLSIASAGDNAFALLANDPSLVVAADLSMAQLACVELRKVVFSKLAYEEMKWFLGFVNNLQDGIRKSRLDIFRTLKCHLSSDSRSFWERQEDIVASGIIHHGKFERYFKLFRDIILPLVHSRKKVTALLSEKELSSRITFYNEKWNTFRWKILFKIFFSRFIMGRAGRDPEFFRYVKGSVAERIYRRTSYALTEVSTHDNPYLAFILTGTFGKMLPYYAREEHYKSISDNLERLELFKGTIDEALVQYTSPFNIFNLSDIFEYMDSQMFAASADAIISSAEPGARIIYWNMLVPRQLSMIRPGNAKPLTELSSELYLKDKAFFYQSFHIDEVQS